MEGRGRGGATVVVHQTEASPLRLPCFVLPLGTHNRAATWQRQSRGDVGERPGGKNNVEEPRSVAATEAFLCS